MSIRRAGIPGVFEGLKVIELGSGAAGPVAARYFAEQGARVIRIESSKRPDFLRIYGLKPDNPHGLDGAPMFILLNPQKESVAVNLKERAGVELVHRLVKWADVVSENFAPGVMDKLGLGYEALRQVKPDLIMVSCCLFGQTGPQRTYPGFGGQSAAIAGFNHLTGWPDRAGVGPFGTVTDSLSPRFVALAVTAALREHRKTGKGQYIDVSQIEVGVYCLSESVVRYSANQEILTREGNRHEHGAPHGIYPCKGGHIAIAIFDDDAWRRLLEQLGSHGDALADGDRHDHERVEACLAEAFADEEPHALMHRLQAAGIEAGAVQTLADLVDDPQLSHRGHFQAIEHSRLGPLKFEHAAVVLSESPRKLDKPGPNLGEHTHDVLMDVLGMSRAEIDTLIDAEVLV